MLSLCFSSSSCSLCTWSRSKEAHHSPAPGIHFHPSAASSPAHGSGSDRIRPRGACRDGQVALLMASQVRCVCVCYGRGGGEEGEIPACEPVQWNKSRLRSGGCSDVCGLDRALRGVHENWESRERKNRRKERDLACVNKHTCFLAKKTLKARWEFLMIATSQAQTSGLWERCAHQSRTGLVWRQPATPSHSSDFYFPSAWCLCGPALTAARSSRLVFLMSLWVVVIETVGNAVCCLCD